MPGIAVHNLKLVYWPIRKCACTSIQAYIATREGLQFTNPHDAPFEWTGGIEGYTNITFVRHPLSRLYSLWKNKVAPNHQMDATYIEGRDYANGLDLHVFGRHLELFYNGMSFREFVLIIANIIPVADADPHWAPQVTQFPEPCMKYKLERVRLVFELLGVPRLNVTTYTDSPAEWRAAYDADTFEIARAYYQEDFDRLGYMPETDIFVS